MGTYTIKYDVTDSSGNAAIQVIRTIHVVDTTAPDLTLIGADPHTIVSGHAYVELGATAYDTGDGGYISASIVIDASAVNTSVTGTYYVTYNISDSHSNAAATGTRTVNVIDATNPNHTYYHNNSPYYYPTTGTETTTTGEAETTTGHEAAGTGETETTTGTQ